jgi:eukaryotic-like serine/threonine-protein kinase
MVDQEVFTSVPESCFPAEREYAFRHGLLREAAYEMLTESDRTAGHRLAGDWLERVGEKDALTMADHFERGGQAKRAVPWLLEASRSAFNGGNYDACRALAERGLACGAEGEARGLLAYRLGFVATLVGELQAGLQRAQEAIGLLEPGSTRWFLAATSRLMLGFFLGDPIVRLPTLQAILTMPVASGPSGPYALAINRTCTVLVAAGQREMSRSLLARAEAVGKLSVSPDPAFEANLHVARGFLEIREELGDALANLSAARDWADRAGVALVQIQSCEFLVKALSLTGHLGRTEVVARELFLLTPSGFFRDWGELDLALAMLLTGRRIPDAIALLKSKFDKPDRFLAWYARAGFAAALVFEADLDEAVREAMKSLEAGAGIFPIVESIALAVLAVVALHRSQLAQALSYAERGLAVSEVWPSTEAELRLCRAEALQALGRIDDAHKAIREARDRVLRCAATLDGDRELRESFLINVIANARTLELAREWLGE